MTMGETTRMSPQKRRERIKELRELIKHAEASRADYAKAERVSAQAIRCFEAELHELTRAEPAVRRRKAKGT